MRRCELPAGTRVTHKVYGEGTVSGYIYDKYEKGKVMIDWDHPEVITPTYWFWDYHIGISDLEILFTYGP